jgi:hypothetical protein
MQKLGNQEKYGILGSGTMWFTRGPAFQRNISPPSSGSQEVAKPEAGRKQGKLHMENQA